MNKTDLLAAMKADQVPAGWSNLWYIVKTDLPEPMQNVRHGKPVLLPAGTYTFLYRLTDATLYCTPPGEVVMEDTPFELRTHLGFVLHAAGRVLVTGLGLGCVIRGLLANPQVEHITCIENSEDVIKLVGPYMPQERLTIIQADALEWTRDSKEKFDCAWHDLWTNKEKGEPHLDLWHAKLFINCQKTVKKQGAWAFDRRIRRLMIERGFHWIG